MRPKLLLLFCAGGLVATIFAACNLPNGDNNLPDTSVPGLKRPGTLSIIGATAGLSLGATVPLSIQASIDTAQEPNVAEMCVSLWARPGAAIFPFGSNCTDASGSPAADAGSTGGTDGGTLSTITCMSPTAQSNASASASAVGAYIPAGNESTASVFGALYANATCTGDAVAEVGVVIPLGPTTTFDAAAGGPDAAADGDDGSPEASPEASQETGPIEASLADAGSDAGSDGDATAEGGD